MTTDYNCANEQKSPTEIKPLLIRPRPMLNESWHGFLIRVADLNGLLNFRELVHSYDSLNYFKQAMKLTNHEVNLLKGPKPSKSNWGNSIGLYNQNITYLRWCPECIKHHPVHHHWWHITHYVVCLKHKIQLQDTCPTCHQRQKFERQRLFNCQFCGTDLSTAKQSAVDPLILSYQQELINAFEGKSHSTLFNMSYYELIKLTRYIGLFNELDMPTKPGKPHGTTEAGVAFRVVSGAASLLSQWPLLLYDLISKVQARSTVSLSIKHHFGTFYQVLYVNLNEPCYQFLRNAFEDYLFKYWPSLINKRNRGFKKVESSNHTRLTIKQMFLKTGAKPALIKLLTKTGQIELETVNLPSGKQVRLIHEKYTEQLAVLANQVISLKQLALRVGITESRIRLLKEKGLITPLASKYVVNSAQWYFEQSQVAKLSFNAVALHQGCIPIKQIFKSWRLSVTEFYAFINALSKEELIVYSDNSVVVMLGDVWLDSTHAHDWLTDYRISETGLMSVNQAAKALNIKQEVAYHLVKKNLLASKATKNKLVKVSMKALATFKELYISLNDLSILIGKSPANVLKHLHIQPVCGPTIDGCRQYFYLRDQVTLPKLN